MYKTKRTKPLRRHDPLRQRRVLFEQLEDRRLLATIAVTSSGDTIAVDGFVTLREAITSANDNKNVNADVVALGDYGTDTINFNIPGSGVHTISPTSALPTITGPVTIDGYTQPGASVNTNPVESLLGLNAVLRIELDGTSAGAGVDGLRIFFAGGSTIRGLVINRFNGNGIFLLRTNSTVLEGNLIGTDASGRVDLGNTGSGVFIGGDDFGDAIGNRIGGTTPAARNLISGNNQNGVLVSRATNNVIEGNFVGTDATGTVDLGNALAGVLLTFGVTSNRVGGTTSAARNIISGNNGDGVSLRELSFTNQVLGNFIGTDITGTQDLGNSGSGVGSNSQNFNNNGNVIGGTAAGAGNIISGNGSFGVNLNFMSGSFIQGNYIGTDVTGTVAIGNGNGGVGFFNSSNTTIGGDDDDDGILDGIVHARNVISGNPGPGISGTASGTIALGNFIGTQADGISPLGNGFIFPPAGHGVDAGSITFTQFGGMAPGAGNVIAFNAGDGIFLARDMPLVGNTIFANGSRGVSVSPSVKPVTILRNSIFANGRLGIDLVGGTSDNNGVTANDIGDTDGGPSTPNNLQNFPVLTSAAATGTGISIQGTLNSTVTTRFRLEFFANEQADPSGHGEGQTFLGFTEVTTDTAGNVAFTVSFAQAVSAGHFLTATATHLVDHDADPSTPLRPTDTSEFSAAVAATAVVRRPVLIVPGIGGTYVADLQDERDWLLHRGVAPDQLRIDPIAGTYDALIETLKNAGYVEGQDLFVATYDWRLAPGPDDGVIDGHIDSLTAALNPSDPSFISITDGSFDYGVDYLGHWLRQAAEAWASQFGPGTPLDAVDVIVHSTGGLVTRTYMESDAYGEAFVSPEFGTLPLPTIDNFIMVGVPNRGATLPWNPLHDNFIADVNLRLVFSSLVYRAYEEVASGGTIAGPVPITFESILDADGQLSHELFVEQYIPTLRSLLATYDFLQTPDGPLTNVNQQSDVRNSLLLDLNNGLDLTRSLGDFSANDFANLATVTAIYGENLTTPTRVIQYQGENLLLAQNPLGNIVPFDTFFARHAEADEIWYQDVQLEANGDTTVPVESSAGQFVGDSRITLHPFRNSDGAGPDNTDADITHGGLLSNPDVQRLILETLGQALPDDQIVTEGGGLDLCTLATAIGFPSTTLDKLNLGLVEFSDLTFTCTTDANGVGLDIAGNASLFGNQEMAAAGRFTFERGNVLGVVRIGAGVTLDIGPGFSMDGNYLLQFNSSRDVVALDPSLLAPGGATLPSQLQEYLTVPAQTARLVLDGSWKAGGLAQEGTLALTASTGSSTVFDVFARGNVRLGALTPLITGSFDAADSSIAATVSGTIGIDTEMPDLGVFGALAVTRTDAATVLGAPFSAASATFNVAFNTTGAARPVAGVSVPPQLAELVDLSVVAPRSFRALIDGRMELGPLSGSGTYLFQAGLDDTSGFQVYAHGAIDLGAFAELGDTSLPLFGAELSATVVGVIGVDLGQNGGLFGSVLVNQDAGTTVGGIPVSGGNNTFNVAFNLSAAARTIDGIPLPESLQPFLDVDARSVRLFMDRDFDIAGFGMGATLMLEVVEDRLVAFESGHVALGLFGNFDVSGYLRIDPTGLIADLSLTRDSFDLGFEHPFQLEGTFSLRANTTGNALTQDDPMTPGFDETTIAPGVFVQVRDGHLNIIGLPVAGSFTIGLVPSPNRFVLSIPEASPLTFTLWNGFSAAIYGSIDTTGLIDMHIAALFQVGIPGIFEISGPYTSDPTNADPDLETGTFARLSAGITRTDPAADAVFDGSFDAQLKILTVAVASFSAAVNECGFAYFTADVLDVETTVYVDFNEPLENQDLFDPDTSTTSPGVLRSCDDSEPALPIVEVAPALVSGPSAPTQVEVTLDPISGVRSLLLTVPEGNGGNSADLQLSMPGLPAGGSVTVSYQLVVGPPSLTAADTGDITLVATGTLILDSSTTPVILPIPLTGDFDYERDESFELLLSISASAGVTDPQLALSRVFITIDNDDPERPGDAVVFYNFDELASTDPVSGQGSFTFTRQAAPSPEPLTAGDFTHSNDAAGATVITAAPGVFKIHPEEPPANSSQAAAATAWTTNGQEYFQFQVGLTRDDLAPFEVVLDLYGFDFWDHAGAGGPEQWELYSSLDDFEESLATGTTHTGAFGHNARIDIGCLHLFAHDFEPLTFRLVALGGTGSWAVDNVALLGSFEAECNDAPQAGNDFAQTVAGRAVIIDVLRNDTDVNRDPVTISDFTQPDNGTVELNRDRMFTYTPNASFTGSTDSFTYTLADGTVESAPAAVIVNVLDGPPDALGQTVHTNEDTPLAITLSGDDAETPAILLKYKITRTPAHGSLQQSFLPLSSQSFIYRPSTNYHGPDSFQFTVTDAKGQVSAPATVHININSLNDPPRVTNPTFLRNRGSSASGNVLVPAYVSDADNDPLTMVVVAMPVHGHLAWNPNGTFTYSLLPFHPDTNDAFGYVVLDGRGGVTPGAAIINVPNPPVASDQDVTIGTDTILGVTLNTSVAPADDSYTYTIVSIPASAEGTLLGANGQPVSAGAQLLSSYVVFTPAPGFVGESGFTYQARSGALASNVATIHITVEDINGGLETGETGEFAVANNYVIGATVFLDANGNGLADFLDSNGNGAQDSAEPTEPSVLTGADGVARLTIAAAFDRNGNGRVDTNEGRLVATGGIVLATGLPLTTPLFAPLGSSVITPLTTLISELMDENGLTLAEAQTQVRAGLGLANFDLTRFDHVAQAAGGNPDAPAIAAGVAQVHDFVAQVSAFLTGTPDAPASISRAVNEALAEQLVGTGVAFDLGNATFVAQVVHAATTRVGMTVDPPAVTAAATVIATGNQRIQQIVLTPNVDFLTQLERVQAVALRSVTANLALFGAGSFDADLLLGSSTGAVLDGLIQSAVVSDILPPPPPIPALTGVTADSVFEGGTSILSGNISNAANHALTLEIRWGDGNLQSVSLAQGATSFAVPHQYFDDATTGALMAVLLLTDGSPSDVANTTLTVDSLAPTASITGPAAGVPGQTLTFTLGASDASLADQAAGFTYQIDWDGNGTVDQIVAGPDGTTVTRIFTGVGSFTPHATATDKDGAASVAATLPVTIASVLCQAGELSAGGTAGSDSIVVTRVGNGGTVEVLINNISQGMCNPMGRIVVYGQAGDDDIQLDGSISVQAWLDGGEGNDRLKGGAGNDVLLGSAGDDLLSGGGGRDLQIGGAGKDRIVGNADDDILIAGPTAFDADIEALSAIMAEWTSARDYAARIANLDGTGSGQDYANRANGNYFFRATGAAATALDDGEADVLTGSSGLDWFFANLGGEDDPAQKDKITDLSSSELAADLDFILGEP